MPIAAIILQSFKNKLQVQEIALQGALATIRAIHSIAGVLPARVAHSSAVHGETLSV